MRQHCNSHCFHVSVAAMSLVHGVGVHKGDRFFQMCRFMSLYLKIMQSDFFFWSIAYPVTWSQTSYIYGYVYYFNDQAMFPLLGYFCLVCKIVLPSKWDFGMTDFALFYSQYCMTLSSISPQFTTVLSHNIRASISYDRTKIFKMARDNFRTFVSKLLSSGVHSKQHNMYYQTHCGLLTPYAGIELGQHRLR